MPLCFPVPEVSVGSRSASPDVALTELCACRAQRALAEACACSSQCPEFQRPSEVASFTHTSTSGRKVRGVFGYAARALDPVGSWGS
jgi:hypothetical protein